MRIPFAVGCYRSRSVPLSGQRLVNAQMQKSPDEDKSPAPVFRTPGIKAFASFASNIRGAIRAGGAIIVIAGTSAYSVSENAVATLLGTIPGADSVRLATSGTKTVCLANGNGYVIDSAVTQITDGDFVSATDVAWVDGYFIFLGVGKVFHSALNDPLTYDALAYDYPSGSPGSVVSLLIEKRDLIHFKDDSIEVWYNKGTTPFAFGRAPDGFIDLGCAAPRSPAKLDNSVFWLASDKTVRVLRGATPTRVSTEVIEQAIASYSTVSDAYGMTISYDGKFSYVLTFPSADVTFEYNIASGEWNERSSFGLGRWQAQGVVSAWDRTFAWSGVKLGEVSHATYAEWDDPLQVVMTSKTITAGPIPIPHYRLEVQVEPGVGLVTGQGSNPQIVLRYSDDCQNWSPEFWRLIGRRGNFGRRAVWARLGRPITRFYELAYSEPTPFVFYGAFLNEEESLGA